MIAAHVVIDSYEKMYIFLALSVIIKKIYIVYLQEKTKSRSFSCKILKQSIVYPLISNNSGCKFHEN